MFVPFLKHHFLLLQQPLLALGFRGRLWSGGVQALKYTLLRSRDFAFLLCDKAVDGAFCLQI